MRSRPRSSRWACSFTLLQSLLTPVLARIQTELDTDQTPLTWVLTGYLLSAAVAPPILGRVGDRVGKQRMLVVALITVALGCFLAAVATHVGLLIFARVVQGLGGGIMPLTFGIVRDEFPPEKVAARVGFVASLSAIGAAAGMVLAGPIIDVLGYHWLFWLPGIVSAVAAVAAIVFIPESPVRKPGRISLLSAVLLSGWLVCLLLALSQGGKWGWTSPEIVGLFAGTVVIGASWVLAERRTSSSLIWRRRRARTATASACPAPSPA